MKDTTGSSKKAHRGYAFIVYEREKDMKGTATIYVLLLWLQVFCTRSCFPPADMISLLLQPPTKKQMVSESGTDVSW